METPKKRRPKAERCRKCFSRLFVETREEDEETELDWAMANAEEKLTIDDDD